jgi:hypothetical protein
MNRKLLRLLPFFALLPVFSQHLYAQTSTCQYTIILEDSFGDGWNGGVLTVTSGAVSTPFTLITGILDTMTFEVTDGAPLIFTWVQGSFLGEISYQILDNLGNVVSEANAPQMPVSGVLYAGIGDCVTCSSPVNFRLEDVWDTYAKLRWSASPTSPNPAVQWRVIYGLQGFSAAAGEGDTAYTVSPKITLTGLQKKTWYDAYIEQYCDTIGGWSNQIGPVSFETYWTKDVGISGVVSPASGCSLGAADTVRILLKNYGAAPQSLIPFRYTVNGEEVNIPKPNDGVYTGVLGKDSVETIAFETTFDFSAPGEYMIVVYSKYSGDQDLSNDTFTYYVNNRLLSPYLQQFEVWDGGWQVGSEGGNASTPSFAFGAPDKPTIPNAASGQNAWVTNLTGPYNDDEVSYLESPCFDFTSLTVDPVITFSIARDIESSYDGAWLEVSVDGGNSWDKVGSVGEGLNWYNEDIELGTEVGDAWSGNSFGWLHARHFLTGVAGEGEVRFRFVFASDVSLQLGGLGIDDVHVFPAFNKDLAGEQVTVASEGAICGLEADEVVFTFINLGAQTQSNFDVAYSVNGGTPVVETISGSLDPDKLRTYTFNTTFDSRDALSVIKCWTKLSNEFAPANDTATFVIDHRPLPTPFQENFESQVVPQDWITNGFVTNTHGNNSYVLSVNLLSFNPEEIHDLPRYGLIGANDSLEFSYRVIDYFSEGPFFLTLGTKFELQVSTDCGETYQTINTINGANHTPTTVLRKRKVSLAQFAGQSIAIRFLLTWASGNLWFDLDNVNLLSCAADMALAADVIDAGQGQSNGSATIEVGLGNPPYKYNWSNGATTQTVDTLAAGTYTVTVIDAFGCSDSFEFSVGTSATVEMEGLSKLSLHPNPTGGQAIFVAEFDRSVEDAHLQVLNLLGQTVWEVTASNTTRLSENIDLTTMPNGLYLVRLSVDGQLLTRKLVKNN